jgi:hypothetical protein
MNKTVVLAIIVLTTAGMVSAQTWGRGRGPNWNGPAQPREHRGGPGWSEPAQPVTVTGTLGLRNGVIALTNEDSDYYVPALGRYIGFIEGLKEGAQATVDGYVHGSRLRITKLTLNGKTYDFPAGNFGPRGYGPDYHGDNGRDGRRGRCR